MRKIKPGDIFFWERHNWIYLAEEDKIVTYIHSPDDLKYWMKSDYYKIGSKLEEDDLYIGNIMDKK